MRRPSYRSACENAYWRSNHLLDNRAMSLALPLFPAADRQWEAGVAPQERWPGKLGELVILGSIFCITRYGQTDLGVLIYSIVAIWSLMVPRWISPRS